MWHGLKGQKNPGSVGTVSPGLFFRTDGSAWNQRPGLQSHGCDQVKPGSERVQTSSSLTDTPSAQRQSYSSRWPPARPEDQTSPGLYSSRKGGGGVNDGQKEAELNKWTWFCPDWSAQRHQPLILKVCLKKVFMDELHIMGDVWWYPWRRADLEPSAGSSFTGSSCRCSDKKNQQRICSDGKLLQKKLLLLF